MCGDNMHREIYNFDGNSLLEVHKWVNTQTGVADYGRKVWFNESFMYVWVANDGDDTAVSPLLSWSSGTIKDNVYVPLPTVVLGEDLWH